MLFSCKISSAVLSFWDLKNEDLSLLLESTSLPEEFLRDPSYWMKAPDMEAFLSAAQSLSHEPSGWKLWRKVATQRSAKKR